MARYQNNQNEFCRVLYTDDVKFEFKIAILDCKKDILRSIKTTYRIFPPRRVIGCDIDTNILVINPEAANFSEIDLESSGQSLTINSNEGAILKIKNEENEDELEWFRIDIKLENTMIPLGITERTTKPVPITGLVVLNQKREKKASFKYEDNKLIQDTQEYFARTEYRKTLEREYHIIESGSLAFIENEEGCLDSEDFVIDDHLRISYVNLINYYKDKRLLPSLTYPDRELVQLERTFVDKFFDCLNSIPEGSYLDDPQINLTRIGLVRKRGAGKLCSPRYIH